MMKLAWITLAALAAVATAKPRFAPVTHCGQPADVVFVIDTSSSIWLVDFEKYVLPFVRNVVSLFDVGPGDNQTRVGAVTFSTNVNLEFNLNTYLEKDALENAISHIQQIVGNTYTNKALEYTRKNMFKPENGGRPAVADMIVVITDGVSSDRPKTIMEAALARQEGASVFAIGVGAAQESELIQIASQPADEFKFKVTGFSFLDSIKTKLALKACEVSISSTTTSTTTTTTTTTTSSTSTTTTTPAPPPRRECGGTPADVFFVLDTSSSIWKVEFEKKVLGFVRDIVSNFDIAPDLTRVGVMTFSDNPRLVIGLDAYVDKNELMHAINPEVVRYTLGGTNTGEALHDVRKIGFHPSVVRDDVAKIAVIITDGQSWNEKKTEKEAALLKKMGVKVYAIGVGEGAKRSELEAMASEPAVEFVFSVEGFSMLSELKDVLALKACGVAGIPADQPVCGTVPIDLTFAFDAQTMSLDGKHHILGQIKSVTERLSGLGGEIRLGVTSGSCPTNMDFPLLPSHIASMKVRRIKRSIKSALHQIVKEWRYKTVGELKKTSSEEGLKPYSQEQSGRQGLVVVMNKDNVDEFGYIAEEVQLLIDAGIEVLVVLEKDIAQHITDKWVDMLGHRRVLSGVDLNTDYSGYIMEFLCAL